VLRVLGADVWDGRWVGVVLDDGGWVSAHTADDVRALVAAAQRGGPLAVVGLDIPVGLAEHGHRAADLEARRVLGSRRSSVFVTPVRAALEAGSHAEAVALSRAVTGAGVSVQAYGLRAKVLEVDAWVRETSAGGAAPVPRVLEVHPEVAFGVLAALAAGEPAACHPLPDRKKSWAGAARRRSLLAAAGVVVPDEVGEAGRAAVDDVLDAAVVAWVARRAAHGLARPLPDPPQVTPDGWPAAIWA
jgi:predicted RNase H-like nuclease